MKKLLLIALIATSTTGCTLFCPKPIEKDHIVYVDRSVPSCPAPPSMKQFDYKVDKLNPSMVSAPGSVVKPYVYDMTLLHAQVHIYKMIMDEYTKTNQDFTAAQAEIDKLQNAIQK
jgi:hypothetical protein